MDHVRLNVDAYYLIFFSQEYLLYTYNINNHVICDAILMKFFLFMGY